MRLIRPVTGKILQKSQGLGAPTPELVHQRARELALINGHQEATEADWDNAFRELHGGGHEADEMPIDMALVYTESDGMVIDPGSQRGRVMPEGEENLGAELVAEGIDEATHDSMLQAELEADSEDDWLQ